MAQVLAGLLWSPGVQLHLKAWDNQVCGEGSGLSGGRPSASFPSEKLPAHCGMAACTRIRQLSLLEGQRAGTCQCARQGCSCCLRSSSHSVYSHVERCMLLPPFIDWLRYSILKATSPGTACLQTATSQCKRGKTELTYLTRPGPEHVAEALAAAWAFW